MTSFFYQQYFFIFLFFFVSILLSFIIFSLSYISAIHKPDIEKLYPYECGFDVRFYLVFILFIIFDLEAIYLFFWVISLNQIGLSGFWVIIYFFIELGFIGLFSIIGFYILELLGYRFSIGNPILNRFFNFKLFLFFLLFFLFFLIIIQKKMKKKF